MGKSNEVYEAMDRIKQRISELEKKGNVGWRGEGEIIPEPTLTVAEQEELEQLHAKLEELKKEDDKTQGII